MKKPRTDKKAWLHFLSRSRYTAKRQSKKWKDRKKGKKLGRQQESIRKNRQTRKPYIPLSAPKRFSLISNTDEVLGYFKDAEYQLKIGENVIFDISEVDVLTPDSVALLVASIKDIDFTHKSHTAGNAPNKPELNKLFTESGFYEHVRAYGTFAQSKENLLHKEVRRKVVSTVARNATLIGTKHVFAKETTFEPLYEILIECMSNTNDHASLDDRGKCRWWLYVYNEPNKKITSYSFLDLGVGIFESAVVKNHLKNILKGTVLYPNINLVDGLLNGDIQSRIDEDKELRGKGIPQIVEHAASKHFRSFYIIANDVKIDLKTRGREQLKHPINGTFLYWELQN